MNLKAIISLTSCLILSSCLLPPGPHTNGHARTGKQGGNAIIAVGAGVAVGTIIATLPHNHAPIGANRYYYDGMYYRDSPQGYVVIAAPIGVKLNQLPTQYQVVQYQGDAYYESKGAWYRYLPTLKQYQVVRIPNFKIRRKSR